MVAATLAWMAFRARLRYVIGRSSLRIMLGRATLRRIPYDDIGRVGKSYRDLRWNEAENWRSSFDDSHRLLVLEKRTGRFRKVAITPRLRYEFRAELREAIARHRGSAPEPDDDKDEG
jgi:hypothetical protein